MSYHQVELCHNITTSDHSADRTLTYSAQETGVVAQALINLHYNFSQLSNFRKGVAEFREEGVLACKKELDQMHRRTFWCSIAVKELSRREKKRAQEGLMLLTRKRAETSKDG